MVLALDIGNSSVALGIYDGKGRLVLDSKMSSKQSRLSDEYAVILSGIFAIHNIIPSDIDGVIISSVVPPLTGVIEAAVKRLVKSDITPMIVGPGIKTGLNIKIDHHTQLGSDIVANITAAFAHTQPPFAVIDMGSATTITVVNVKSELCGVIIVPGVKESLDSLSQTAAELPCIALERPKQFLARNTVDSMKCGVIYGNTFMINGFLYRITNELGLESTESLNVIATGGLAECIIPNCDERFNIKLVPTLTLDGLYKLYVKNRTESSKHHSI